MISWRRAHGIHHATSGNLDLRGIGDVDTLTVREYLAMGRWRRLGYRPYRHPLVMFGVGPTYLFILQHRFPCGLTRDGWVPWFSTMATNGAIALVVAGLMWWIGVVPFLMVHLPITVVGGAVGVCGCFTSSTNSSTRRGLTNGIGPSRRPRFTAARIMICQSCCAWFTANIGVGITASTTCAAEFRFTGCRSRFVTIPISPMSAGSHLVRVLRVFALCFGMKRRAG